MKEKLSKNLASLMKLQATVVQRPITENIYGRSRIYTFVFQKLYSRTATIPNTPPLNINLHASVVK
jgi:hypothetical protein